MNRRLRPIVLLALAALLTIASPVAHAEVPSATITEPADGYAPVFDWQGGAGPYAITVKGTAGEGTVNGDRLDIVCERRGEALTSVPGGPGIAAEDVPVTVTGTGPEQTRTFSVSIDAAGPALRTPCRLRAIAADRESTFDPVRFPAGPRIFPSGLRELRETALSNPNLGALYDLDANTVTNDRRSTLHLQSFGGCGLWDARPLDPATGPEVRALDVFECAGFADDVADLTGPTRSELQVDGADAFTGAMAAYTQSGLASVPGRPVPALKAVRDPGTGALTLTETTDVVRCAKTPPSYPFADPDACGSFVGAGVRLVREARTSPDGRVTRMKDRWEATDGREHIVDLLLEVDLATDAYGIRVPWTAPELAAYPGTAVFPAPPAVPASILVASDRTVPDGDLAHPAGAITMATAPTSVEFVSGADPSRYLQLRYLRSVTPAAPLALDHVFSMAPTAAEAEALAAKAEDAVAGPSVAITAPAAGSRSRVPKVLVRGVARDSRGIAALFVAGRLTPVAPDGSWRVAQKLMPGPNTILARAVDGAGNVSDAQVTVTYRRPGAAARCVVPKLAGLASAARAGVVLRRAGCRLGRTIAVSVPPRRVRKGRRTALVRVPRGAVVGSLPQRGRRLAAGAKVDVLVQGRRTRRG